jgi:hypothetical protein
MLALQIYEKTLCMQRNYFVIFDLILLKYLNQNSISK